MREKLRENPLPADYRAPERRGTPVAMSRTVTPKTSGSFPILGRVAERMLREIVARS